MTDRLLRTARRWLAGFLVLGLGLPASAVQAQDELELRVKAAYLYNFAKFVTWPAAKLPGPDTPVRICVVEREAMAGAVDEAVGGKTLEGRAFHVVRARQPEDLHRCHIAYLGELEGARLGTWLAAAEGRSVLTVHEAPSAQPGGIVRFYLDERKVRFEINTAASAREGLQVSARLLSVASLVNR